VVLREKKGVQRYSVTDGETGVFIHRLSGHTARDRLIAGGVPGYRVNHLVETADQITLAVGGLSMTGGKPDFQLVEQQSAFGSAFEIGVVGGQHLIAEPTFNSTITPLKGAQTVSNDLAVAGIFVGGDFRPSLSGHLVGRRHAELPGGSHHPSIL
jgi:hypothetical protein